MSPNETLFLESTNKVVKEGKYAISLHPQNSCCWHLFSHLQIFVFVDISNNSFISFTIWDFPGQMDIFDHEFDYASAFKGFGALVYVIDSQVRL